MSSLTFMTRCWRCGAGEHRAASGASVPAEAGSAGRRREAVRDVRGPDVTWYLGVAAFMFATGALGVLVRRSPLIVLLSLELMLNACNLALIAFSRLHGGGAGQIFALSVMAVAASEVVVGLGLIVAMARRNLALDVDKLTSLRG